jgi:hypothetical protein
VGLKSLKSLNLTNGYPNKNNKNKNNNNNKVKSKPLELRSRVKIFLVTSNDFGSSKTNPGQRPKHHFCCGDMGKKVKYHKRGDLGK